MSKPTNESKRRTGKRNRSKSGRLGEQSAAEILESLSDACVVLDRQWRYTYVNRAAARIANLRREEMLGRTLWEISPERASKFEAAYHRAMDQGVTVSFEEYYPTLKAWFEHTVYPSTDRITFCARDVTEHKRVDDALRERERFIRQVAELTPVLINVFDLMTERNTYISPNAINVVGYTPDEITQMNDPFALWHPEDVPRVKEHLARSKSAADGEIREFEYRIRRHDGEWRWLATRSMPFARSEHGEVRQIFTATIDITEQKRADEAVKRSEERWRSLIENSSDIISVLGTDGTILYESPSIKRILGYQPEELIGRNAFDFVHPDDVPRMLDGFARTLKRGEEVTEDLSCRMRHKNGSWRTIEGVGKLFVDDSGELVGVFNTRDITERKRADEALRASEERLRVLIESAEDYAIITLDTEGRVSGWNSGAARTFGYKEAEIIGRSHEILFTPEDRERGVPLEEMKQAREERRALDERYYFRKNRTRFFGSGVTAVLRDHNGHGYVKITRDLTERKQAEEALHRAHEKLEERVVARTRELTALNEKLTNEITDRKLVQEQLRRSETYLIEGQRLSHTGSGAWNVSTGEAFWSDETYRIYGFEPGNVKPSYEVFFHLVHPEERLSLQGAFENAVRERSDYDLNFRIVRPDEAIRYIHGVGHPIFNESGDLTELVGTVMDVTDRKEAEEKLVASEHRFRLLLESIPHHVWSFRADGTAAYWNQRLIDYTGLTTEELRQGRWAAIHPDDVERVRAAWGEAWSKGTPYEQEQRLRGRNGRYRRFLCRGIPSLDERGQVLEWFGTDTDIEDLRQAEEMLHAVQAELAHMARVTTMGELAASIAHEVSQPLTAVVANSNACIRWLARDAPNLEEAHQALFRIAKEAHRASEVINRIRTFLKRSPPEKVRVDINDLIRDTIALVRGEIVKNQVLLQTDLGADLPPISGDRIQLQQVILNLIMNAIEATSARSERTREIVISSQKQALDQIVIAVRDAGIGIDPANVDQLFKPFTTTKAGGMGMGLSISRSIVEAHGGRLWATPNEQKGATFQFSLPVHTAA